MTITDTTPRTLRDMTDEDLLALYREAGELTRAAALREAGRRDRDNRLAKSRARLAAIQAEGERQAYAQYREASASDMCKGKMLSRAGQAAFDRGEFTSEEALWRMPEDKAQLYASEELNLWWKYTAPRVTARDYVRQQAAEKRGEYAQARDNREARNEHYDGTGLDDAAAGALRRPAAAPEAPERAGGPVQRGRRAAGEAEGRSGDTRDGRAVRPVRRGGTVTGTVAVPAAATAAGGTSEPRIPGDQLLDLVRDAWLGFFARYPSPAALDAVTLWAAHTHMRDEHGMLMFRASPRLYLLSSEPGSGKSHVLELLARIVPACHGLDLEPTGPGLAYTLSQEKATVLLDEGDILVGQSGNRKTAVRAIINGGTYRHGTYLNGRGAKATRMPVFGPLALAGLDVMETQTGDTLAALMSRGITVRMRKAAGEDAPPRMTVAAETAAGKAKTWLERWAGQVRDEVAGAEPELPDGIDGRAADIWEPMLAIADAAGRDAAARGAESDWPDRARAACLELALGMPDGGENLADEFAAFAGEFAAL